MAFGSGFESFHWLLVLKRTLLLDNEFCYTLRYLRVEEKRGKAMNVGCLVFVLFLVHELVFGYATWL